MNRCGGLCYGKAEINKERRKIKDKDVTTKILSRNNNEIYYAIYRKPTCTSITIPNNSNHPPQYKMAAFLSLFNRRYKTPLNTQEIKKKK